MCSLVKAAYLLGSWDYKHHHTHAAAFSHCMYMHVHYMHVHACTLKHMSVQGAGRHQRSRLITTPIFCFNNYTHTRENCTGILHGRTARAYCTGILHGHTAQLALYLPDDSFLSVVCITSSEDFLAVRKHTPHQYTITS